jgi:receptor protein-tyrosine kinase
LRTPDEVTKRIGIRIIGTTTSPQAIKRNLLPKQVTEDYQTIRANLGLLDSGGMPKTLVVTSAGMREGKTTFSINFSTSLSMSGKKVLLIDGDLRKPDIAHLLNLPKGSRTVQDLLLEREFDHAIPIPSTNLDVLPADSRNMTDAYELLALPMTPRYINNISQKYDHVIIDTPPVLAFPDALMWAKIADAVILTTFAGQTIAPDLKRTKERLAEINVRVLGTILSNVPIDRSYYRYGYNYYAQNGRSRKNADKANAKALLLPAKEHDKPLGHERT